MLIAIMALAIAIAIVIVVHVIDAIANVALMLIIIAQIVESY